MISNAAAAILDDDETQTEWVFSFPVGDRNYDIEVSATKDGLDIEGYVISWDDLEAARLLKG